MTPVNPCPAKKRVTILAPKSSEILAMRGVLLGFSVCTRLYGTSLFPVVLIAVAAGPMKVNLQRDKGVALEPTGSTKFISTLVNGNIIAFGVKAKFLEMMKCFLKVISKKA